MTLSEPLVTALNNKVSVGFWVILCQDTAAAFVEKKLLVVHFHSASIMISVARANKVILGSAPELILSL